MTSYSEDTIETGRSDNSIHTEDTITWKWQWQ